MKSKFIPTPKAPAVDAQIIRRTGFDRQAAITSASCVFCKRPVTHADFRDEPSLREYHISGICQQCQDQVF